MRKQIKIIEIGKTKMRSFAILFVHSTIANIALVKESFHVVVYSIDRLTLYIP